MTQLGHVCGTKLASDENVQNQVQHMTIILLLTVPPKRKEQKKMLFTRRPLKGGELKLLLSHNKTHTQNEHFPIKSTKKEKEKGTDIQTFPL